MNRMKGNFKNVYLGHKNDILNIFSAYYAFSLKDQKSRVNRFINSGIILEKTNEHI